MHKHNSMSEGLCTIHDDGPFPAPEGPTTTTMPTVLLSNKSMTLHQHEIRQREARLAWPQATEWRKTHDGRDYLYE